MFNISSYAKFRNKFVWSIASEELGFDKNKPFNIGWYCSDRICELGKGGKTALIYEGISGVLKYTFDDIRLASNTIGSFLRSLGIVNGDRVCLFMDKIPELYFVFLGILKIGSIVQPLFSAFGDESLQIRLENAQTRVIITQKKYAAKIRKIKNLLPDLQYIIIVDCNDQESLPGEIHFHYDSKKPVRSFEIFETSTESPSVLHYTSGTTGQPKGVKHIHYSLLSQYLTSKWVLDLKDSDVYWCTADPGWVTGTSYGIIGPWSLGITQCVLDSGFSAATWYKFMEKHKVSVWYTAPTAIRSLMKAGEEIIKGYNLENLRILASVGEPLNPEAVIWGERNFGKPFLDTYWQTETGAIMISNLPGMKVKPGSMGKTFPGVTGTVIDAVDHTPIREPGKPGLIAFKPDWPSLMKTYWNNEEAYRKKFVNGWYLTGDKAFIDSDGYFWFIGRDDDVINTGGHLVSPFEVESALLEHPAVAESAVVATPDEINMEVVKAFITLNPGFEDDGNLELEIMNFIRKKLSSFAMPKYVEFMDILPKTRSGKILRRLLHAREWGEKIGDISTLED